MSARHVTAGALVWFLGQRARNNGGFYRVPLSQQPVPARFLGGSRGQLFWTGYFRSKPVRFAPIVDTVRRSWQIYYGAAATLKRE